MRYIDLPSPLDERLAPLYKSQQKPPHTSAESSSRWHSFSHKPALLLALLDAQFYLCCYSELRADEEGLGYHIEHIENKSQNPPRTFDESNLAASALMSEDLRSPLVHGQLFGGHAKGKQAQVDMHRFISCRQPDCERYFAYLSNGRVVPARILSAEDRDRAQYTIDLLNLNSLYLVGRRRQWWLELETLLEEHTTKDWDVFYLAQVLLQPERNRLSRFFSLSRQFWGAVSTHILQ